MRKSIVTKYFCICSVVILACVICIGSVLLLVASQFYKTEKKEALIASVNEVIAATKLCYLTNDVIDTNYLNKESCGITHIINAFKNNPIFGVVEMVRSERSKLAAVAAKVL